MANKWKDLNSAVRVVLGVSAILGIAGAVYGGIFIFNQISTKTVPGLITGLAEAKGDIQANKEGLDRVWVEVDKKASNKDLTALRVKVDDKISKGAFYKTASGIDKKADKEEFREFKAKSDLRQQGIEKDMGYLQEKVDDLKTGQTALMSVLEDIRDKD